MMHGLVRDIFLPGETTRIVQKRSTETPRNTVFTCPSEHEPGGGSDNGAVPKTRTCVPGMCQQSTLCAVRALTPAKPYVDR